MARARFEGLYEVGTDWGEGEYNLYFQYGVYRYWEGQSQWQERGYRFIWKDGEGHLLPQRGQARIPDGEVLLELLEKARRRGWFPNPPQAKDQV